MKAIKKISMLVLLAILFAGCEFNKSIKTDLLTGLTIKGDGLSAEDVFVSVNNEKVNRTTFVYGEEFLLNFNNVEGFTKENGKVYPGIRFVVTSQKGDTVMKTEDLYSQYDAEGITIDPLLLSTSLIVANPVKSNNTYTMHVSMWDKRSKGVLSATLDFKVEPNKKISVEKTKVNYDEIYLFSKEGKKVITSAINADETTFVMIEGLTGFMEEKGMVFPGMSLKVADKNGKVYLDDKDLFTAYNETGVSVQDLKSQISASFSLAGVQVVSPVVCDIIVWDKKSDARIKAVAEVEVKK